MTVVMKQMKCKPQEMPTACLTAWDEISALIDDIGTMLPAVEAKQKMIKALQGELQPYVDQMRALTALLNAIEGPEADDTFQYQGTQFIAMVGKRGVVRRVTNPALAIKLLNKVEKGIAWQVISVPLGKLNAYLTPEQRAQVIAVDRGDRPVTIAEKPSHTAG